MKKTQETIPAIITSKEIPKRSHVFKRPSKHICSAVSEVPMSYVHVLGSDCLIRN